MSVLHFLKKFSFFCITNVNLVHNVWLLTNYLFYRCIHKKTLIFLSLVPFLLKILQESVLIRHSCWGYYYFTSPTTEHPVPQWVPPSPHWNHASFLMKQQKKTDKATYHPSRPGTGILTLTEELTRKFKQYKELWIQNLWCYEFL